ncbi:MAG: RNA polymerase subunit sigma, partial [Gemmataceae bacterium]|nr:RNA polymerase subunit sigma [Gemmataceae bacterium]
ILVEAARRKQADRHGGGRPRVPLPAQLAAAAPDDDLLAVDGVVDQLAAHKPEAAELVKLHVFAGLTLEEAAAALGLSARTGYRTWAYARAWMFRKLGGE